MHGVMFDRERSARAASCSGIKRGLGIVHLGLLAGGHYLSVDRLPALQKGSPHLSPRATRHRLAASRERRPRRRGWCSCRSQ